MFALLVMVPILGGAIAHAQGEYCSPETFQINFNPKVLCKHAEIRATKSTSRWVGESKLTVYALTSLPKEAVQKTKLPLEKDLGFKELRKRYDDLSFFDVLNYWGRRKAQRAHFAWKRLLQSPQSFLPFKKRIGYVVPCGDNTFVVMYASTPRGSADDCREALVRMTRAHTAAQTALSNEQIKSGLAQKSCWSETDADNLMSQIMKELETSAKASQ